MVPDANLYITLSKEIGHQFLTKDRSFLAFGRHVIIHCRSDTGRHPFEKPQFIAFSMKYFN